MTQNIRKSDISEDHKVRILDLWLSEPPILWLSEFSEFSETNYLINRLPD